MKRLLFIGILLFTTSLVFADADDACRYKVKLELENEIHEGYLYIWTYAERFNPNKVQFSDYIKKVIVQDSITLYTEIKTISIGSASYPMEIDLTSQPFIKKIDKNSLGNIQLLEELEYYPGDRVHKITNEEYLSLKTNDVNVLSVYNEQYIENCTLLLISESNNTSLAQERDDIEIGLGAALKIKVDGPDESIETNKFISESRLELIKKKIILLIHCDAL